jgi:ABC-type multidrug transport system fused ATPase/permease subunit
MQSLVVPVSATCCRIPSAQHRSLPRPSYPLPCHTPDPPDTPACICQPQVKEISLYFLYLGLGSLVCSYLEAALWMWTGNRQANRIRQRYLAAVMRQEIAFFDTQATTGGLLAGLNEDSIQVQNAISEKLGGFIHHAATFLVGFAIAFWRGWDMTLVSLCTPAAAMNECQLCCTCSLLRQPPRHLPCPCVRCCIRNRPAAQA